jgi:hypothetical protein
MKKELLLWLQNIKKKDGIPPNEVIAFNFGIFESENGYMLYLVGSFEYFEENDDWACIEMPTNPYRYLRFPEDVQSKNWEQILKDFSNMLLELESDGTLNSTFLKSAKVITTGFDDGDLIKIRNNT